MSQEHGIVAACFAAICRCCYPDDLIMVGFDLDRQRVNPAAKRTVRCPECDTTNVCRPMMDAEDDSNHRLQLGHGSPGPTDEPWWLVDAERPDVVTFEGVDA